MKLKMIVSCDNKFWNYIDTIAIQENSDSCVPLVGHGSKLRRIIGSIGSTMVAESHEMQR